MGEDYTTNRGKIIQLNEEAIRDHLGQMVRNTVEETLNQMLDAEADKWCCRTGYFPASSRNTFRIVTLE